MERFIDFDLKEYNLPEPINKAIPAGDYILEIVSYELKYTKQALANNTKDFYANLKLRIVSGEYENRILFDMLNLKNANQEAEVIGRQRLKSIAHYSGKEDQFNETKNMDCFLHAIVGASVGISKEEYKGEIQERNRIKYYKDQSKINIYSKPSAKENTQPPFPSFDDDIPFGNI